MIRFEMLESDVGNFLLEALLYWAVFPLVLSVVAMSHTNGLSAWMVKYKIPYNCASWTFFYAAFHSWGSEECRDSSMMGSCC